MNREQYEKLPIKEKAEICSNTQDGYIFICSKDKFNKPIFKWKDTYFKMTQQIPKSIKELRNNIIWSEDLPDEELTELLNFLNSFDKNGFTTCKVNAVINYIWKTFD